jgi:D-sedoheptulose 7-phosphate isomerase|tara:strand:- start:1921 stop:2493 length:573 start_codon:yes stop_codon:yes gene_type:complete
MNNLKNIKNKFSKAIISFQNISSCSNDLNKAINLTIKSIKNKKKIIFCGNGGSAADSQHLTAELVGKFLKNRKAIAAISLTTNTSSITSIGNDLSFDKIFSRQLEAIAQKGDVLFAISTSGKSKNILNAIEYAHKNGLEVILLTSIKFKKKLKKTVEIKVPANRVDRIQEMHICIGHIFCEEIENNLFKD